MINNSKHDESAPENCFCPVCNVHRDIKKKSRSFDIHKEHNTISSDGIKEQRCPIDRLQTVRTNLHQTMDHSSKKLLKLKPYLVLDTDPTLVNLNYSNPLSRYPRSFGK